MTHKTTFKCIKLKDLTKEQIKTIELAVKTDLKIEMTPPFSKFQKDIKVEVIGNYLTIVIPLDTETILSLGKLLELDAVRINANL